MFIDLCYQIGGEIGMDILIMGLLSHYPGYNYTQKYHNMKRTGDLGLEHELSAREWGYF